MQEINNSTDEVIQSLIGPRGDIARLAKKKIEEKSEKVTSRLVISPLPDKDQVIEVMGIKYQVYFVNKAKGEFHARIIKLESDLHSRVEKLNQDLSE